MEQILPDALPGANPSSCLFRHAGIWWVNSDSQPQGWICTTWYCCNCKKHFNMIQFSVFLSRVFWQQNLVWRSLIQPPAKTHIRNQKNQMSDRKEGNWKCLKNNFINRSGREQNIFNFVSFLSFAVSVIIMPENPFIMRKFLRCVAVQSRGFGCKGLKWWEETLEGGHRE